MKIIIDSNKYSDVLYNGSFYQTGRELDVSFSDYLRLSTKYPVKAEDIKYPYNPDLWKLNKTFGFSAALDTVSGFGGVSVNLLKSSIKKGHDPRWVGNAVNVNESLMLKSKDVPENCAMIWHEQPKESWEHSPFSKNIAVVPFETTRVPASWVPRLNKFDAVFVPCVQNVQMMKDSGVTVPIELIHWGVDETLFKPIERKDDGIFTFGTLGALSNRKGTDILVDAFLKAFPPKIKDVRLICKTSYTFYYWNRRDPRIEVQMTAVPHEEMMREFYSRVDAFVFPTRGEGFGLTPLEAMATGIPAIITGWSGLMEYYDPKANLLLDYKMVPATDFTTKVYKEDCGQWSEPNEEDLIEKMRWCYNNQDEVKKMGKYAAEYVKENWTWDKKIDMFTQALDKHL